MNAQLFFCMKKIITNYAIGSYPLVAKTIY